MRFLLDPGPVGSIEELVAAGEAAHRAGLDGVFLEPTPILPAPLVAASALASRVPDVLVAAAVEVGDSHPFRVAEEAAVVDVASGGRLILVARPAEGAEDSYGEALELMLTAFAARPFRFEGARWTVPANLPENVHNVERQVRLMPAPIQPRLPVWGEGAGRSEALRCGLGYLAPADENPVELARDYERAAAALGPAALGAPRARRHGFSGRRELVEELRAGRAAFGQDWATISAGPEEAITVGSQVRPRLQLDRLPDGLEDFWDRALP